MRVYQYSLSLDFVCDSRKNLKIHNFIYLRTHVERMVVKEEMVLLSSCSPPDEGIRKKQDNTSAFIGDKSLGKGTLFIAERYTVNGNIQVVPPLSRETS